MAQLERHRAALLARMAGLPPRGRRHLALELRIADLTRRQLELAIAERRTAEQAGVELKYFQEW